MPLFTPARKERLKARVAIDGPTGSGKTWTALQWARILAGPDNPVGLIDTENRSAAYYSPEDDAPIERLRWFDPPYEFGHMPWEGDYDPRRLTDIIVAAGDELGPDGVLIIDSLTHFWTGKGGTLDIVDHAGRRFGGNSYSGWQEGTPANRNMLDAIIFAPFHVIVTMRSKMEYVLTESTNKRGETVKSPTKVGMAPEQRAGVEYEFTVVADMDLEHRLTVSKSRCDVIADVVAVKGESYQPAEAFAAWLGTGVERIPESTYQAIADMIGSVEDAELRNAVKRQFKERFGNPRDLLTTQVDAVYEWLGQALEPAQGELPVDASSEPQEPEAVEPEPAAEPVEDPQPEGEPEPDEAPKRSRRRAAAEGAPDFDPDALADAAPEPVDR